MSDNVYAWIGIVSFAGGCLLLLFFVLYLDQRVSTPKDYQVEASHVQSLDDPRWLRRVLPEDNAATGFRSAGAVRVIESISQNLDSSQGNGDQSDLVSPQLNSRSSLTTLPPTSSVAPTSTLTYSPLPTPIPSPSPQPIVSSYPSPSVDPNISPSPSFSPQPSSLFSPFPSPPLLTPSPNASPESAPESPAPPDGSGSPDGKSLTYLDWSNVVSWFGRNSANFNYVGSVEIDIFDYNYVVSAFAQQE